MPKDEPYGLLAEFDTPEALLHAARTVRRDGYTQLDAFSPFAIEGVTEALGFAPTIIGWFVLGAAITGGLTAYAMQWYSDVVSFPMNVGGRPDHSWPSYIVITFELTILFGSLGAAFILLAANGLPRYHHPLFSVAAFARATNDRFFLLVCAADPKFDRERTRALLLLSTPHDVHEVPNEDS